MTEQYQVTIQGQLGPREGVLTLSYQESYITGSLDLVGYVNKVQGVRHSHLFIEAPVVKKSPAVYKNRRAFLA